jgi:hypothetical protein
MKKEFVTPVLEYPKNPNRDNQSMSYGLSPTSEHHFKAVEAKDATASQGQCHSE